ncbi:glycosyltransferase family 2 protein [Alloalcanivorax mobilis]|uniref:glycosyltransferase family 2 protein n=1 Tax=Alloalcanivorax mobilis TaxID=2019569 RepID=UPI0012FFD688|nr:glycosyltransferase family 2 protein [Alloalcanivorax mobilis]
MSGKVQVVTRTKDRPIFLQRALQGIIAQSYQNWHCTVVNDGGEPFEVERVIASLEDKHHGRISIIHNAKTLGMEAASNIGLNDCEADYYVIHDDDDSWAPSFLEVCVAHLESSKNSSIQGVAAKTIKVMERLEKDKICITGRSLFLPEVRSYTIPRVAQSNPFMPIAFLYTRKALKTLEGYDESLPVVGDWEFNLRFIEKFDIAFEPNTEAYYHVREVVIGQSSDNSLARGLEHQHYRAMIVNRHIRKALEAGDITLGHLLAATEPGIQANRLGEKFHYLYFRLKRLSLLSIWKKVRGGK